MKKIVIIIFIFIIINLCFIYFTKCKSLNFNLNNPRSLAYSVGIYENEAMVCSFWWHGGHGGIVEFFENKDDKWQLTYSLNMNDIDKSFKYGKSCAICKGYAAVCADVKKGRPGAVVILKKEGEKWIKHQILQPEDKEADDCFGFSIDMFDEYLIIGAENKDNLRGAAYLFKLENDKFTEIQKFEADDFTGFGELFGEKVSIYKDYMAISAPDNIRYCEPNILKRLVYDRREKNLFFTTSKELDIIMKYKGAVYVYKYKDYKWVEIAKLHRILYEKNINFNEFGINIVSINDKFIIADSKAKDSIRHILYVFKIEGEKVTLDTIIDEEEKDYEFNVIDAVLDGNYLIVNVSFWIKEEYKGEKKYSYPRIHIYKNINGKWVRIHRITREFLTLKDECEKDYVFGRVINASNRTIIIGSQEFDTRKTKTVLPIMGNVNIVEFDDKGFKELFFYPPKEQTKKINK